MLVYLLVYVKLYFWINRRTDFHFKGLPSICHFSRYKKLFWNALECSGKYFPKGQKKKTNKYILFSRSSDNVNICRRQVSLKRHHPPFQHNNDDPNTTEYCCNVVSMTFIYIIIFSYPVDIVPNWIYRVTHINTTPCRNSIDKIYIYIINIYIYIIIESVILVVRWDDVSGVGACAKG